MTVRQKFMLSPHIKRLRVYIQRMHRCSFPLTSLLTWKISPGKNKRRQRAFSLCSKHMKYDANRINNFPFTIGHEKTVAYICQLCFIYNTQFACVDKNSSLFTVNHAKFLDKFYSVWDTWMHLTAEKNTRIHRRGKNTHFYFDSNKTLSNTRENAFFADLWNSISVIVLLPDITEFWAHWCRFGCTIVIYLMVICCAGDYF